MSEISYRESHAAPGYGNHYEAAYSDRTYYGQLWNQHEQPLVRRTLEKARKDGASRCLDFACGTGRILDVVCQVFDDVTGVDVSESMIGIAREKCPAATVICRDITSEPIEEKFDVATAFRFFRNAEPQLRRDALDAIREQLSDDGVLVANIHGNPISPGMIALSMRSWLTRKPANTLSESKFDALLKDCGFEIVEKVRYSYLPQLGRFFPRWYGAMMGTFEKLGPKIPLINMTGESTLYVARVSR